MKALRVVLLAAVLAGVLFGPARDARAEVWRNLTVIDVRGWAYEGVAVEWASDSSSLQVTMPTGARRLMPPKDIRVIRTADGRDITGEVLKRAPADSGRAPAGTAGSPDFPAPKSDKDSAVQATASPTADGARVAARPAARRSRPLYGPRYRFGVGGGVGYSTPSGEWFEDMTGGVSFGLRMRLAITDNLYLGGSFGRQNLGTDHRELSDILSIHLNEYYLLAGAMTRSSNPAAPVGYLEAGIGVADHKASVSFGTLGSSGYSDSYVALDSGVGVIVPVSQSVGVDCRADLRVTGDEYSTGVLIGFRVGLWIMTGR